MSVIIVHGTHDPEGEWWIETTLGSFAAQIDEGLVAAGAPAQVWRIENLHVSAFRELRPKVSRNWLWIPKHPPFGNREGRFSWSGADYHGAGRLLGGTQLARYLETLTCLAPEETIHVIAHSHGCNVVKQATQVLRNPVKLGRIAFLACPHFVDVQTGGCPYRLNPGVLGSFDKPVLNFYSPQDTVQTTIAEHFADLGLPPGMPGLPGTGFAGTPLVKAHRTDQEPAAHSFYEDFGVEYDGGEGTAAHGAVHNPQVGRFLGTWFAQQSDVPAHQLWSELGYGTLKR